MKSITITNVCADSDSHSEYKNPPSFAHKKWQYVKIERDKKESGTRRPKELQVELWMDFIKIRSN